MNYRRWAWYAGVAVIGFAAGRYRRHAQSLVCPAPTVVERVVEKRIEVAAKHTNTLHVEQAPVRTVWRDRVVTVAGVDRIVREVERVEGPVRTVEVASHTTNAASHTTLAEKHTTLAPRPSWAVTARAGSGLGLIPRYGGGIERRILGGVWVGVEADTTRTAWARLRVEW